MKLYPKCHPYWLDNQEKIINEQVRSYAYTSHGYIVPCCYMDPVLSRDPPDVKNPLIQESLLLKNNSSVKAIMLSEQWIKFHKGLIEEPEKAPSACKLYCSKSQRETEK
jgi:hypothetical protein